MADPERIPTGFVLARTTNVFDESTAPAGLLKAHRVSDSVWARLVVLTGSLHFVFEDEPDNAIAVTAGETLVIPPSKPHHVALDGPVGFAVEFYRRPDEAGGGLESSGLQ